MLLSLGRRPRPLIHTLIHSACVCLCVRACVRACVCVCKKEGEGGERAGIERDVLIGGRVERGPELAQHLSHRISSELYLQVHNV